MIHLYHCINARSLRPLWTLEEMRLQEQQQANALAMEQNDLLDRQNSIAEKARRDANIAAAVGAVQRHNTNKAIKKWMEK